VSVLPYLDHRSDPGAWARELGVSHEAVELHLASDVIDLHIDSFIWTRTAGYDLTRRHGRGFFGSRFYSQVDLPRALEAGLTGAIWSVTTNPVRGSQGRIRTLSRNVLRLTRLFARVGEQFQVVTTAAEYRAARAADKHGAFICVQGGNALGASARALAELPPRLLVLVTLVHLTDSQIGCTSSPLRVGPDTGLTEEGRDLVRRLNHQRIFVDLAHISPRGFWDALEVHDRAQPLLVSHTGVCGRHRHWRNLDDEQLRAVATTGGTVGIILHIGYLGRPRSVATVVDHLEHVVRTVGEDHACIGSDFDGSIITPRDLQSCLELPRLTHEMLSRGWQPERIQTILGGNFLRALGSLRG
jgi:membrane dipeptidase